MADFPPPWISWEATWQPNVGWGEAEGRAGIAEARTASAPRAARAATRSEGGIRPESTNPRAPAEMGTDVELAPAENG
eukprot:5477972-Prymnesium_polylepis.1